ncbi:MAG: AAA family ATPase [Chloroflexota bacterium]|nr:AAA family ATPase [Chloroflexota bacterium]
MEEIDTLTHPPARFRFRNIGPVKDAELELGDLTVIAGRNNTGKTYIAYTLYGFLKMYREWPEYVTEPETESGTPIPNSALLASQLRARARQPLHPNMRQELRATLMQEMIEAFSDVRLSGVFSSPDAAFQDASFAAQLPDLSNHLRFQALAPPGGPRLSLDYGDRQLHLSMGVEARNFNRSEIDQALSALYLQFLFPELPSGPFILSSERIGISLFYRELDFTKNRLVDLLQQLDGHKRGSGALPFLFLDQTASRYALPIKDNIDYTRSIPDLRGTRSDLCQDKLFDGIKDMMSGYYGNSGDDVRFISKARGKGRSFNIPLHLASSSARGLSDLYFFLRNVAKKGQLLIIDEPESHLDTANQRLLARLLARSVRAGLKVLVTTHSDYLIMEINNLVMLSQSFPDREALTKKLKYKADDCLEADSIRAYIAEGDGLTPCKVNEFGVDMPIFDRTIDEINRAANELGSRVSEGSGT